MKLACDSEKLRDVIVGEANTMLVEKPVKMTTLERIRLFSEADEHVRGLPQPLQYGRGLAYVLERIGQPINKYDLLMGRISEEVPDEAGEAFFQEACRRFERGPQPWEKDTRPFWIYDVGHCSFYWRDVISKGLSGLQSHAEDQLERRRRNGDGKEGQDFLEGAILVYSAVRGYLLRYAGAAEREGLDEAAEACRNAANRAPQTFREALQMLWAIMLIYDSMLTSNPTLTYGRLDQFLYPLYEKDIAENRLTRDEAGLLILDFYCKNNLIMGRGEHQLSGGDLEKSTGWLRNLNYDAPQYLVLGGSDEDGVPASNDLTLLFAEQVQPRFKNPVIVVQYTKGMAEQYPDIWRELVRSMRASASMMAYNDANVTEAFIKAGVDREDAANYEHFGCNWPCLPGLDNGAGSNRFLWEKQPPPDELRELENEDARANHPGGLTGELMRILSEVPDGKTPESIEYFYTKLNERFRYIMKTRYERALMERMALCRAAPGVLQFRDCFEKESVNSARCFQCGSAKYYSIIQSYGGFATLADCLTAIDSLLYKEKKMELSDLVEALKHNFEGYEIIHSLCRKVPKLGSDDELSNYHGRKLLTMLTDTVYGVQREYSERGEPFILVMQCIETDTGHIHMGKSLGATPDGRLAGTPLSQNSQPSIGASINGMTARLRSLAQLPFNRIMSGAQNLSIQPKIFAGEHGLKLLSALVSTYFELGGNQLQISAADVAELIEAQKHPEGHRDLMVRITGYSAVFVDMGKQAQDDIISREQTAV